MQFVDEVTVEIRAGDGGNGAVAFRREKYMPLGGPAGGDGGAGGDVIVRADGHLTTLYDLRYRRRIEGESGEHGRGKDQYGCAGESVTVRVPVGTQVFDADSRELLVDLDTADEEFVIARGGRGGRGNIHFSLPHDRAPRRAEAGGQGQKRTVRLELKLIADVGIIGFPNVGKSTLIAAVSRARPKIADYPFTTLAPNLGVVSLGGDRSFVVADIPGIIEGAAEGAGLGLRFLKHVERTRALLHLVSLDPSPGRDPIADFDKLLLELRKFNEALATRPMLVAVSKCDLPDVRERFDEVQAELGARGYKTMALSSATGIGVTDVLVELERMLTSAAPVKNANAAAATG